MLLRSSRVAESITKQSGLLGTVAKGVGGHVLRNWKPYGGAALVGAMTAPAIASGMKKGRLGTNKRYIQAQQAGYAPRLRPGQV